MWTWTRTTVGPHRCGMFWKQLVAVPIFVALPLVLMGDDPPAKKQDPQSTYEPKSAPGAGQKYLAKFEGEWNVAKAFYPRGGGEPSRASGVCRQKMIHEGRFLQSDFVFGTAPNQTTGLGLIGFDPSTGRFTSVWTDSRQIRMSFRQGEGNFDGEQIVLFGQTLSGDKEGRRSKTITRLEDQGNTIVHRQYSLETEGSDRLVMELVMKRKTGAKDHGAAK